MKFVNRKSAAFLLTLLLVVGLWFWMSERAKNRLPVLALDHNGKGGYTLLLDGKPFLVKGVCYNPIPVGKDYSYDFYSDASKPWIRDGRLMKQMGVNAVRLYKVGENPVQVKEAIRTLHRKYDIRSFVGHYLGFWDWPPANYADPAFQAKITQEIISMVETYKNEPGIIGWILGNENNYSFDRNIRPWTTEKLDQIKDAEELRRARAEIYYQFINDLAKEVRRIDPARPVIMGIGEVRSLDVAANLTPDIDILGVIAYRGATFGNLFRQVRQIYDKPVLMIEYGADRYNAYTREEDEDSQARFLELQWKDIERHSTVRSAQGNVLGGTLFEWTDEWWKGNENLVHTWSVHDTSSQWSNSSYYYDYEAPGHMNINEEWWGIIGVRSAQDKTATNSAPDRRIPKKGFFTLKDAWSQKTDWTGYEK